MTENEIEPIRIRTARLDDRPAIGALIGASARGLSRGVYEDRQIESALQTGVFGVDSEMIADGTYLVAEARERIVGCGGWSERRTLFGGDAFGGRESERLDPAREPARIRAFFVHPDWARRGVGRAILERCETDARAAGYRRLDMMATLPGLGFYRASGYAVDERVEYTMEDGVRIDFVRMSKTL
jgi:GNAT superfamily N-acetyltransferase